MNKTMLFKLGVFLGKIDRLLDAVMRDDDFEELKKFVDSVQTTKNDLIKTVYEELDKE